MTLASRRAVVSAVLAAAAALSSVALPSVVRAADGPAAALIESTAAKVIDVIKSKPAGPERQAGIRQVLESDFDLPYMGRSALGTNWAKATPEEQQRFLKAAVEAEAHAYSERFGQYGGQTLTVGRVTDRGNGVFVVDSKLNQTSGQPISIQWEVHNSGAGLKISDVKIEGVSMVMTRRSDFTSYIQNHGGKVEPLIVELENRSKQ